MGNYKLYGLNLANSIKCLESAKIAREKIIEIWDKFPLLKKEIIGEGNFGSDYVKLIDFYNGNIIKIFF